MTATTDADLIKAVFIVMALLIITMVTTKMVMIETDTIDMGIIETAMI